MDAMQTELNSLQVENRRLKEDCPDQAATLEGERELERSREENARLVQELGHLRALYEQLLRGTQEADAEAAPLAERCATLEREAEILQSELAGEREVHAELDVVVKDLRERLDDE